MLRWDGRNSLNLDSIWTSLWQELYMLYGDTYGGNRSITADDALYARRGSKWTNLLGSVKYPENAGIRNRSRQEDRAQIYCCDPGISYFGPYSAQGG